jgi:two-component system, OmpR family, copper resistance phosphate regulon response regulator CusR
MRILIVEDDAALSSFIKKGLEAEHHAVDVANEGNQGRAMAMEFDYDLVVLDLNLPGVDGLSVLKSLRQQKASLPVMILTARTRIEDRVQCLDSGADDYLVKPFSYLELSARARIVTPQPSALRVGDHRPRSLFGSGAAQSGARRAPHRIDDERIRAPGIPHAQCRAAADAGNDHRTRLESDL